MAEAYGEVVQRASAWFESAAEAGWLDEADRRRFAGLERATPADLFATGELRPLVVALFGGTGVGKSSLLNRLAGGRIAEVGVERPTSRDVTVYVHESVELADLPAGLPVERVRVRRHDSPGLREVMWIDAPDIDSTEEENRRCALAWMPHVDLLCYVVSPERYRDDIGWRVLRERGHRHGWMFAMNRWDEGDPRQREDFRGMLRSAGFDEPLLYCTCCTEAALPTPDEFDQIRTAVRELLEAHVVRELTRLGHRARVRELRELLDDMQHRLGGEETWTDIRGALSSRWQAARQQLLEGAGWGMQAVAARFAVREEGLLRQLGRAWGDGRPAKRKQADGDEPAPQVEELSALTGALWDDWSDGKVAGCLDAAEIAAARHGVRAGALRQRLDEVGAGARAMVTAELENQVRLALARPGHVLARLARRATGFLMAFLPTVALAVVAYNVVIGYARATTGQGEFLGVNFAVQSVLLVVVAWALPFVVDRLLRPSLERAVLAALRAGFGSGLDVLGEQLEAAVGVAAEDAGRYATELAGIQKAVAGVLIRPVDSRSPVLARLLQGGPSPTRGDDAVKAGSGAGGEEHGGDVLGS
ncbi:MAG: GTPase domain-containing protein [Phycisphaerae bacterium]|jgi:hypothetical protein